MNEEIIDDLKQFITATMGQLLAQQANELRNEFNKRFDKLDNKIDKLSASVAEALDNSNEETEKQLKNHETRLTKLEAKAA